MRLGSTGGGIDAFPICTPWWAVRTAQSIGTEDYLWVTGTKPVGVYLSPDVSSTYDSGTDKSYPVWTTDVLNAIGIGFILRWRAQASDSNGAGKGAWRYPASTWTVDTPPSSDGFPFYQATYISVSWLGGGQFF